MSTWKEKVGNAQTQKQADEQNIKNAKDAVAHLRRVNYLASQEHLIAEKKQLISDVFRARYGNLRIPEQLEEINQEFWNGEGRISLVGNLQHYVPIWGWDEGQSIDKGYTEHLDAVGYWLHFGYESEGWIKQVGVAVLFRDYKEDRLRKQVIYVCPYAEAKNNSVFNDVEESIKSLSNFRYMPRSKWLELQSGLDFLDVGQKFDLIVQIEDINEVNVEAGLIEAVSYIIGGFTPEKVREREQTIRDSNLQAPPIRPLRRKFWGLF